MSPDSCSDFASSFDPFNHSPPPSLQILLQPLQIQFHNLHFTPPPSQAQATAAAPSPPPQSVRGKLSQPHPLPLRTQGFTPISLDPPHTGSRTTLKRETSQRTPLLPPLHSSLHGKQLEQKALFGFASHSPSTIYFKSKSCLAPSLQTRVIILKEFKYPTQSYNLTWHDIYIILSSTLLPEEKERVWQAPQVRADEIHRLATLSP